VSARVMRARSREHAFYLRVVMCGAPLQVVEQTCYALVREVAFREAVVSIIILHAGPLKLV
jgi:hypothetical protein